MLFCVQCLSLKSFAHSPRPVFAASVAAFCSCWAWRKKTYSGWWLETNLYFLSTFKMIPFQVTFVRFVSFFSTDGKFHLKKNQRSRINNSFKIRIFAQDLLETSNVEKSHDTECKWKGSHFLYQCCKMHLEKMVSNGFQWWKKSTPSTMTIFCMTRIFFSSNIQLHAIARNTI